MRSFQKKNRLGKFFVNSLILGAALFFLSGPAKELAIFLTKSFANFNQVVSENSETQIGKLINFTELIQIQREKINKLNALVNKQEEELNSLKSTLVQTNNIEDILKLKQTVFPKAIACRIISRSPSSWQKEVIIDKGSNNGLKPSMVVVTSQGILGQIQEVKKNYSIVQLMTSSQVKFGAILERTKIMGILFGDKPGYAQFKFIPIGSNVQKGDLVITSEVNPLGIERLFPSSYPIGRVVEVAHYENNAELFIRVKLFEDGSKSYEALVLLPGDTIPKNKIDFNLFLNKDKKQNPSTEDNIMSLNSIPAETKNDDTNKNSVIKKEDANKVVNLNKPAPAKPPKEIITLKNNLNPLPTTEKPPASDKIEVKLPSPKAEQPPIANPINMNKPINSPAPPAKPPIEEEEF